MPRLGWFQRARAKPPATPRFWGRSRRIHCAQGNKHKPARTIDRHCLHASVRPLPGKESVKLANGFQRCVRKPSRLQPSSVKHSGVYTVTARCGGGNLGVLVHLHVTH